ncbi:MAG TPA: NAD(P)H-binding protein, partial [Methylocystis sp.]|nr:NAD(P)H-binding protein [Methylocystis sp.]
MPNRGDCCACRTTVGRRGILASFRGRARLSGTILIYGATGYTGKLIARVAVGQGARPILAGRNLEKVEAIAKPLGLAARAFDLRDPRRIDTAIKDVSAVLCVAGPFSTTSTPMANA